MLSTTLLFHSRHLQCLKHRNLLRKGLLREPLTGVFTSKGALSSKRDESFLSIWTVPNMLSASRIALCPFIAHSIISENYQLALSLIGISALTDMADGWIARRFHQKSSLGSILDPLGDKITVATISVSLLINNLIPSWLFGLFVARDALLILKSILFRLRSIQGPFSLRAFFNIYNRPPVVSPTLISKINTALQFVYFMFVLSINALDGSALWLLCKTVFEYLVAGTTILSWISYIL